MNPPQEGYYKTRAWSRGPWVPARIYRPVPLDPDTGEVLDRYPRLQAEIDGTPASVDHVWERCQKIEREEWEWLTAMWSINIGS